MDKTIKEMPNRNALYVAAVFPQDVREQISALVESGVAVSVVGLGAVHRDSFVSQSIITIDKYFGTEFRKRFSNFLIDEISPDHLVSVISPRVREALISPFAKHLFHSTRGDRMGFALDAAGARILSPECEVVFAREDAAEQTFLAAKRYGIPCVYDQPTPHHATVRRLMKIEIEEFPSAARAEENLIEWQVSRTERKTREAKLASRVLVASEITGKSLCDAGISWEKVTRIPYGCNPVSGFTSAPKKRPVVLYVGNINLRKGIPRLLRVWKDLGAARTCTLRLVGKLDLPREFLDDYIGQFEHIPWVPRTELSKYYHDASFLVFPTVADGFGLVINEALSHGLPVLASSNNGAPGFITNRQQGCIYQHGNDDEFSTVLNDMLTDDRRVSEYAVEARELARQWPWTEYRKKVSAMTCEIIAESRTTE